MAISLEKGSRIDLTKTNANLTNLHFGLGWDVAGSGLGGLVKGLFGGSSASQGSIDLDASVIVLDDQKRVIDTVYFGNLRGAGISHSGDNRTGAGDGDDEVITVNIPGLSPAASSLVLTINSFTGQTFNNVANAHCRILNKDTGEVLATYNLSAQGSHTAVVIGSLYKHNGEWKFRAIGELAHGRTAGDLKALAQQLG